MKPKIEIVFENTGSTELSISVGSLASNMSNIDRILIPNNRNYEVGFQLSSSDAKPSDLSGKYTFFGPNGFNGFLSAGVNDCIIALSLSGAVPEYLYIQFDPITQEYAKTIEVNAAVFSNSSTIAIIRTAGIGITPGETLRLTFKNWSAPGKSFKITQIAASANLFFTSSEVINFKCSENLMDSDLSLTPGICEQYADIEVYDRENVLHTLALNDLLERDAIVRISATDVDANEYQLGSYIIADWDIENDNSHVQITSRDKSYLFETIDIPKANIAQRSLDDLLTTLFDQANILWSYLDEDTHTRCQNIVLPNNWYVHSSLKKLLDKICSIGMLRMYWFLDIFYVGRCV